MAIVKILAGREKDEEGNISHAVDVEVEGKNPKQLCEALVDTLNEQNKDSGYMIPPQYKNVAYVIQQSFIRIAYNTFILPTKRADRPAGSGASKALPEDF